MHKNYVMENLIKTSQRLVNSVQTNTFRYLYSQINWDDRLIMIKGARGVGKTTMLRQRIKERFGPNGTALLRVVRQSMVHRQPYC